MPGSNCTTRASTSGLRLHCSVRPGGKSLRAADRLARRLFLGITLSQFLSALAANWTVLRIYPGQRSSDLGLQSNISSLRNGRWAWPAAWGPRRWFCFPRWRRTPPGSCRLTKGTRPGIFFSSPLSHCCRSRPARRLLFRGYGFQTLMRAWGPYTTIFTVGRTIRRAAQHESQFHLARRRQHDPGSASFSDVLFCAAATYGCRSDSTSAGISRCRFSEFTSAGLQ